MNIELIMVTADNNNKFYRMNDLNNGTFAVEYGRIGESHVATGTYPISQWKKKYDEKIRKGYKDVSDYKKVGDNTTLNLGDPALQLFYDTFLAYTKNNVKRNYTINVGAVTKMMLDDAQGILNSMLTSDDPNLFNQYYLRLFTILPRRISNVRDELVKDLSRKDKIIAKEQDILDSLLSQVDITTTSQDANIKDLLNVDIKSCNIPQEIHDLLSKTNSSKYKPYKVFEIKHDVTTQKFNNWVSQQNNKHCEYLIHGTRNPNVFSILKSGLILRPTNVVISGAAYGEGIYHSAHTDKSLGYTGSDGDKIFFIQNVHMGNYFTYDGWYRDGKSISRSQMNYKDLRNLGYDSLYVKPGDGLRNSEYIVYNSEQTTTSYLVWMK